ncbi:MAG: uracil-DNA glycosylase [Peptococcaceae bacterium]|jgi:DNA polymerase|nr:uracil-DNA glycosylase [Peptococcaceae bacterium]
MTKSEKLNALMQMNLACRQCALRSGCRGVVFGEGDMDSPVMFVGEGPGQTEDEMGRPFVGRAGELLNKMLTEAGFRREDVYITNIVKCRPPGNRTPSLDEMERCLPWLRKQYAVLKPRFMVLMGLAATHGILDKDIRMNQCRGKWFRRGDIQMLPIYHPAAVLRNPAWFEVCAADLRLVKQVCEDLRSLNSGVRG